MKSILKYIKYPLIVIAATIFIQCSRADENDDVLSQEDISNILLNVKDDATGVTETYNYTVNSVTNPTIKLVDGRSYTVNVVFKNGNEDETESIISAKDEHFLIYSFQGAQINLTRQDTSRSTRTDGKKIGLITKWNVIKTKNLSSPQLVLTLVHDAASVNEAQNGTTFGSVEGGETDAMATFGLSN